MVVSIRHPILLYDIAKSIVAKVTPNIALADAIEEAKQLDIEHVPVTASSKDNSFIGILNCYAVRRLLSVEVLARQQKADNIQYT